MTFLCVFTAEISSQLDGSYSSPTSSHPLETDLGGQHDEDFLQSIAFSFPSVNLV